MIWRKLGLIFKPQGQLDWLISHAAVPFAEWIDNDIYRIYFCGRNKNNKSQIGYIELNINNPKIILNITNNPIIRLGDLGCFDDSAVMPNWIMNCDNNKLLYYNGWSMGVTVPFFSFIGLAVSTNDGVSFTRYSKAPILERHSTDPYMTHTACVRKEHNHWQMWYSSGTGWRMEQGKPKHYYHIKYAESENGIYWKRTGTVCIDYQNDDEYAIARPCVVKDGTIYKMWFSYRGPRYRIGYAESLDGLNWRRKDEEAGINVSDSGWDSEMIEYPFVFDHKGERYMLYNGNGYGRTGFGLAILEHD